MINPIYWYLGSVVFLFIFAIHLLYFNIMSCSLNCQYKHCFTLLFIPYRIFDRASPHRPALSVPAFFHRNSSNRNRNAHPCLCRIRAYVTSLPSLWVNAKSPGLLLPGLLCIADVVTVRLFCFSLLLSACTVQWQHYLLSLM